MNDIAYCGLNCASCPVRAATLAGDDALLDKLAAEYSAEDQAIEGRALACQGCHTDFVSEAMGTACGIRVCASKKDIPHCGHCAEYPCAVIDEYLGPEHPGRATLDEYAGGIR